MRTLSQGDEIKKLFYESIEEKVAQDKRKALEKFDTDSALENLVLRILLEKKLDWQQSRNMAVGSRGEAKAFWSLWFWLSNEWCLINDLVLEPERNKFMQVDHLLIGPPGIFVIETKSWAGSFIVDGDYWRRRVGRSWKRYDSPITQNLRHVYLLKKWLVKTLDPKVLPDAEDKEWLFPIILFTGADRLIIKDSSMPIFQVPQEVSKFIKKQTKKEFLHPGQAVIIANRLVNARPFAKTPLEPRAFSKAIDCLPIGGTPEPEMLVEAKPSAEIKAGTTKQGKQFVRIAGSEAEATATHAQHAADGKNPGPLRKDRYKAGGWFFYLNEH